MWHAMRGELDLNLRLQLGDTRFSRVAMKSLRLPPKRDQSLYGVGRVLKYTFRIFEFVLGEHTVGCSRPDNEVRE